jgi:hypothetical protein
LNTQNEPKCSNHWDLEIKHLNQPATQKVLTPSHCPKFWALRPLGLIDRRRDGAALRWTSLFDLAFQEHGLQFFEAITNFPDFLVGQVI